MILLMVPQAACAQNWLGGGVNNTNYNEATNWSTGTVPDAAGEIAGFGSTGSATINVTAGPIAPQSWNFGFNSQNYVISGQDVNFSNGVTNGASAGRSVSIANNMTGTDLSQIGAGTLILTGANSFTTTSIFDGKLVNGGTLQTEVSVKGGTFVNNAGALVIGSTTILKFAAATNAGGTLGDVNNLGIFQNNAGNAGAVFNANRASNGGTIASLTSEGLDFTNTGTITGLAANGFGVLTTTGTIGGGLTNLGAVYASGTINGVILNRSQFNGSTLRESDGLVKVTGNLLGNNSFTLSGSNARLMVNGGDFTGITTLTNNSTSTNGVVVDAGRLLSAANISNSAGAFISNSGTLTATAGPVVNAGNLKNIGAASILNGGLSNIAGTTDNAGTINGGATVSGGALNTATATSVVNGGLTNSATVNAGNQVNGAIQNQGSGVFSVAGALAGNSTFTNSDMAQLAVTSGDLSGITTLTNNSAATNGVVIAAGRMLSAVTVSNNAGGFQNSGALVVGAGGFTNTGGTTFNNGVITGSVGISGGILTGTGSIVGAATIANGGTFAPGNSTAGSSMNITGNLAVQSGALYAIQVSPATSSLANVTGTATLNGGTVQASFVPGSYIARQYTILHAAAGVTGAFSGVVNTDLPFGFIPTLGYDGFNAYLNLDLGLSLPSGLNRNQQNVANALTNYFNANGGIPMVYGTLTAAGLSQAAGETATGSQQTTFDAMTQFMGVMTDPFIARRGDAVSGGGNAAGYADEKTLAYATRHKAGDAMAAIYAKAPPPAPFVQRWSTWVAGFGGSQTTDASASLGTSNTSSRVYGVAAGADYPLSPNTIAGFALAGGGTGFGVNGFGGGSSDLFQAGAFIRHNAGPAYITAALAYGWQEVTTDRTVTVAGVDRLRARFNANAWSGRVEGGYRLIAPVMGGVGFTPYAAGQFVTFDLPNYSEAAISGVSTFALAYAAKSVATTRNELGVRTDKSFATQDGVFTLRGRAAWAHDYNTDRTVAATFQALPGATFVVGGVPQPHDLALATASAEWTWLNGFSVAGTFEGEFSSVSRSYAGKGVLRYAW
ncbi:autotransporter domain-containing protein [Bradyrhizobium sp. WSM 1704]|uniref:autotransporter outer membrane beta-barrel domain-containing protein n=1 Tax=Bradyrhizobium semiaridum TaxID=2821404 RepID=UPI001CE39F35|nr:autotransporter domain-containing protein [Bradyrhizobium semiaridum]MCA6126106.1 autotransporter domain-containing protein [Bradyrhizobium semiaridum]